MNKYKEKYLTALTNRACEIMGKTDITQQDIEFLMLYKSELRRFEYVPKIKRILNSASQVLSFIKQTFATDDTDNNLENKTETIPQIENKQRVIDNGNEL